MLLKKLRKWWNIEGEKWKWKCFGTLVSWTWNPANRGNQTDGRLFRYKYTNVFDRTLSKHSEYCCFAFKYNHVPKHNSRKKSAPLYKVKAECATTRCPVTATNKTFDKTLENINLGGESTRRKKALIWHKKPIQTIKLYLSLIKTWGI